MNDDYVVREDSITLTELPDMFCETIYSLIKATLEVNSLPLSLRRGQAYDGAAVMKGVRNGVSTRIRNESCCDLVNCMVWSN